MRNRILFCVLTLGLSACALPFRSSNDERKAGCDRIAAQAIQTTSLEEAETLSRQATECYARARG
ncbi:MAG: hypothetical protein KY464_11060 [Gemmatimonadetes bacterium]|nr:hypothetical protein [Gemmatimonadota bacterium]